VTLDTSPGFQPFGFSGGLLDRDTQHVRIGARDYDPATGRWLTRDPSGYGAGFNLYSYAYGDPANFIDPDGRHPILLVLALVVEALGMGAAVVGVGASAPSDTAQAPANIVTMGLAVPGPSIVRLGAEGLVRAGTELLVKRTVARCGGKFMFRGVRPGSSAFEAALEGRIEGGWRLGPDGFKYYEDGVGKNFWAHTGDEAADLAMAKQYAGSEGVVLKTAMPEGAKVMGRGHRRRDHRDRVAPAQVGAPSSPGPRQAHDPPRLEAREGPEVGGATIP
jgi:RHS repeat-associated protein